MKSESGVLTLPRGSLVPVGEAVFLKQLSPCLASPSFSHSMERQHGVCHLRKITVDNSKAILPTFAGVSEINEICTLIYEDVLIVVGSLE